MMAAMEPPRDQRRRRRRWLASGAVAVVALVAVAFFVVPGSPTRQPTTPITPSNPATVVTTEPVEDSPTPSDGATPTAPVIPGESPTAQTTPPPATPRKQPTENEDSAPRETKEPVEITAEATPSEGIEVRLVLIESVEGEVAIPGEVGGPALRITVEVTNNTSDAFATPVVVVNLYKGDTLAPAGPLLNPGGRAFPEEILSGDSATGVYLFTVGMDERDDITIEVDLAVGTPIVLFHGPVN